MSKFYWILGAVAVIGIAVLGYQVGTGVTGQAATEPVDLTEVVENDQELYQMARPVIKGNPDAPVTIFEFADFQCPACSVFARQHAPLINSGYVEGGRVKIAFYDFPLVSIHPHAFLAARAARCAEDQGRFWEYHDKLFETQSRWSSLSNPSSNFVDYADEVGVSRGQFEECLNSDRHAELVTAEMQLAQQLRIQGTPTLMISQGGAGQRLASFDFQTVSELLDEVLAEIEAAGGTSPGSN